MASKSVVKRMSVWYSSPSRWYRLPSVQYPAISGWFLSLSWSCPPLISISSPTVNMCSWLSMMRWRSGLYAGAFDSGRQFAQ